MRVGVSLDFQALDFKSRPLAQTKLTLKLFKCFKTFKTFQQKLSNRRERSCHEQKFYFLCCPFFFLITFSFISVQLIA